MFTSMRICKRFKTVIINSAIISIICLWVGLTISYVFALPSGASIVLCNMITFILYFIAKKFIEMKQGNKKAVVSVGVLCLAVLFLTSCQGAGKRGYAIPEEDATNPSRMSKEEIENADIEDLLSQPSFAYEEESQAQNVGGTQQTDPETGLPVRDYNSALIGDDVKAADTIHIDEKLYLTQINDIFMNLSDYEGKTIVVEGMFAELYSAEEDNTLPAVFRFGPGCCGNDGWGGFLLNYDDFKTMPKEGDWMRITGTPYIEETEGGFRNLFLNVSNVELGIEKGLETVYQ